MNSTTGIARNLLSKVAGACLFCLMLLSTPVWAGDRVMIVLDASGSMWGQIEGEAKISIARRVLKDVLGSSESDLEMGLIAYGHREKGQCGDIEIIMEPAAGNGPAIGEAADKLNPLGKTPLSASVQLAAETLKYTEEKATVIVITDGIETCNADPCALGAALAANGIDFTAHVVGFGLSAEEGQQVACLAQETGGLYVPADNADALAVALSETVQEIAEAPVEEAAKEPEPEKLPSASLDAQETVEIGKTFTVNWEGPAENRDGILLIDPRIEEKSRQHVGWKRLVNGDFDAHTVDMIAPVHPGIYELQYGWSSQRKIIATRTIEVIDAAVSLDAPATVEIGRLFTTIWEGPGARRDSIDIVDPTGGVQASEKRIQSKRLVNDDYDNKQVTMPAPAEPGFYQLQYFSGDGREVIATREIEVLDAEVSVDAPDSAPIGSKITINWVGPGARRDEIQLHDMNAGTDGKKLTSVRLVNGDYDNATVTLIAPAKPGTYVLRYWNGDNRSVLVTRDILIEEAEVSLTAPEVAPIGSQIDVEWVGPGIRRDAVEIFNPNTGPDGKVITSVRLVNGDYDNKVVRLTVPATPGEYELRYYSGDNRAVLTTRPLLIEDAEVSLDAPASTHIGAEITVNWVGPGARQDDVQLFDPNSGPDGKLFKAARLVNGDYDSKSVKIIVPAKPGIYVLRYFNANSRKILETVDIIVEDMEVSLDAPSTVQVGTEFDVSWVGPGARTDEVMLVDMQQGDNGKAVMKVRVVNGDYAAKTVKLRAPKEAGNFVLRYWSIDSKLVLYETPITVE